MPIAMTDGTTYENSLDMLFAKDMPSREETDQQQRRKALEEMMPPDMRGPPSGQGKLDYVPPPTEADQLHPQDGAKDQNDPYSWGMGPSMNRTGPSMVPNPTPKFHEIMDQMDYLIDPEGVQKVANKFGKGSDLDGPYPLMEDIKDMDEKSATDVAQSWRSVVGPGGVKDIQKHFNSLNSGESIFITPEAAKSKEVVDFLNKVPDGTRIYVEGPSTNDARKGIGWQDGTIVVRKTNWHGVENDSIPPNARPTAAEFDKLPTALDIPKDTEVKAPATRNINPSPYGETYDKFVGYLEKASDFLNPSFIPTAEEFRDAPWKEKLGFILGTSMMLATPGRGKTPTGETILPKDATALDFWKENLATYDKIEHPVINTLRAAEFEGNTTAKNLLDVYKNIEDPQVKLEFGNIIKNKLAQAARMREEDIPGAGKLDNPQIFKEGDPGGPGRPLKEGSDWTQTIEKPNGTKVTELDQTKLERVSNMLQNDMTYQEIADKFNVSRNSVASIVNRMKKIERDGITNGDINDLPSTKFLTPKESSDLLLDRLKAESQSKPFVPEGALRAPEMGSGSGGGRETELTGKSGISTPNKVPGKAANRNDNLQIDDPVMDAVMDKTWENFGRANKENLPLISPAIEGKLQEMNPAGLKKLKQFELEMDYKYKQPPGRRHWLSDLTEAEADRYRKLYNDIDKIRPIK